MKNSLVYRHEFEFRKRLGERCACEMANLCERCTACFRLLGAEWKKRAGGILESICSFICKSDIKRMDLEDEQA